MHEIANILLWFVSEMFANARSTLNISKERLHCKVAMAIYYANRVKVLFNFMIKQLSL